MARFNHQRKRRCYRKRIAKLVANDINSHPATAKETAIAPTRKGLAVFILGIATRRKKNTHVTRRYATAN